MVGKASIVLILGFVTLVGYSVSNLTSLSTRAIGNMSMYNGMTMSHDVASAGANVAVAKFYLDTSWIGSITQTFSGSTFPGSFTATMSNIPGGKRLVSVSTCDVLGYATLHDTVEVSFKNVSGNGFTLYAWMTNFEGNSFWVTTDTVWGRVHSNGNIHISGSPVFMQKLTTSKNLDPPKVGSGQNQAIFKSGYETGIADIPFPTDLSEVMTAGATGGRKYTSEIWVTLDPGTSAENDGRIFVSNSPTGPPIDTIYLSNPSFNGALVSTGRVNVKGTLDGQLSIASGTDIVVQDNILYERNPLNGPTSDLLGLISEQNVVVADNAENNDNCEIDASIFCRAGSFMADNYGSRPISGTLNVLGSVVQWTRGNVEKYNGGGNIIVHGFSKRYRYDDRLADPAVRPPFYPGCYVKNYSITNWWESYSVMKFQ